jgi:hypothetical protein
MEWRKARASNTAYQRISHALLKGERRITEPDIKTSLSECHVDDRGLLHFRQRIWIPENEVLRTGIIQKIHDSHVTAHPGRDATYLILS